MKALQSIGISKALRFVWYSLFTGMLHGVLPPLRTILLRMAGATIGKDTVIFDVDFSNLYHFGFSRLTIGNRCFLGDGVMLDVRGGITLEDDVTLSNRTTVVSHINVGYASHPLQAAYPTKEAPVTFRRGAYVGTGAIILPGVTVSKESVVGAGAVVTKDVPEKTVVVGVPAVAKKKLR